MDKTIHGNCTYIQPPFSAYRTQLTGKPSTPLERALSYGPETSLRFSIHFVSVPVHDFRLWRAWEYIRAGMHKQTVAHTHQKIFMKNVSSSSNSMLVPPSTGLIGSRAGWALGCTTLEFRSMGTNSLTPVTPTATRESIESSPENSKHWLTIWDSSENVLDVLLEIFMR